MKLFEGHFETIDGEHAYTDKQYVLANDLPDAAQYFVDVLANYFGDETVVIDHDQNGVRSVENSWGTLAAKLDYIAPVNVLIVPTTDGRAVQVKLVQEI